MYISYILGVYQLYIKFIYKTEGKNTMGSVEKKLRKTLEEKMAEREARSVIENRTIENLIGKPKVKDRAISARVNGNTYIKFKKICEARGLTANACLNMLITDFVRENKNLIEQE